MWVMLAELRIHILLFHEFQHDVYGFDLFQFLFIDAFVLKVQEVLHLLKYQLVGVINLALILYIPVFFNFLFL